MSPSHRHGFAIQLLRTACTSVAPQSWDLMLRMSTVAAVAALLASIVTPQVSDLAAFFTFIACGPTSTIARTQTTHSLDSVMEHLEYVKNLVGVDHVGFGPDTVYGDHVGLHDVYSAALSIKEATAPRPAGTGPENAPFEKVDYVKGLENPTEGSRNIVRWLVKHGYSDEDVAKVMGGNALRLLREVWT